MKTTDIKSFILNLLFPKRCIWCGKVVGFSSACPCEKDAEELLIKQVKLNLDATGRHNGFYRNAYAVYFYEDIVRNVIWRLKFRQDTYLAEEIAKIMSEKLVPEYDLIIPVPISQQRLKERGYNQSAVIAASLSKIWGIKVSENCLLKPYDNKKQMELSKSQRKANVIGAYVCQNMEIFAGKRVLLLDDVITTGSTVEECAKMLYCSGAEFCDVYAFAHTEKAD